MKFQELAAHLNKIEGETGRLKITDHLAKLWPQLSSAEIPPVCYLLLGRLAPIYENTEFNLSIKMVLRSLARIDAKKNGASNSDLFGNASSESSVDKLTTQYKKLGDIGLLAQEICQAKSNQQSILDVFKKLQELAKDSGEGSQERKLEALTTLFESLDKESAKLVAKVIVGSMRLGFSDMTILDSLSWAIHANKSDHAVLEAAYNKKADVGLLAQSYLAGKSEQDRQQNLKNYDLSVGVPMLSALCQRLNSTDEIIKKMGTVLAEPKYDGLRVQIHINKKVQPVKIKAFTRNLEDVSHMYPELETALKYLDCDNCILDAEAIGYKPDTGELVSFQETMTRKRKHDIAQTAKNIPLKFFVFDIMYLDGHSQTDKKLRERKELLEKVIKKNEVILPTFFISTNDPKTLSDFHAEQLAKKLEGMVVKQAESPYPSGRKGWHWAKMKEEEGTSGKLADTLDVVVMGYYFGRGKRQQFGLGALLVGVKHHDEVLSVSKIGTGMSEDLLKELQQRLSKDKVVDQPNTYQVHADLAPDVWVAPTMVIEVAADEITVSPKHTAGYALRFPRLLKIREDKSWQQATTLTELKSLAN